MSVTGVDPLLLVIVIVVGTVDTGEDGRLTSKGPFELQVKVEAGFLEMRLSLKRLACQDPRKESLCHVEIPWRIVEPWFSPEMRTRHTVIGCSAYHPWLPGITSGLLVFSDAARHTLGCLRFRHISRLGGWVGYTTLLLNFYTTIFDPICHRDIRPLELNAVLVSKNRSSLVVHFKIAKS